MGVQVHPEAEVSNGMRTAVLLELITSTFVLLKTLLVFVLFPGTGYYATTDHITLISSFLSQVVI